MITLSIVRKACLFILFSIMGNALFAQIPIVYYDFENNSNRDNFQNQPEMSVNTPPGAAAFTYTPSAGGCDVIGCSNAQGNRGAGAEHGGSNDGTLLTVGAWEQVSSDPGTGTNSYYQVSVNTSGFTGISLSFDTKFGNNNSPVALGVLISNNGSSWVFVGSTGTPNGNTIPTKGSNHSWDAANFNLTAANSFADNNSNLRIRIYAYDATNGGSGAYLGIDNFTILATGTSAGKVFTTLDEDNYYTCLTSGLTGSVISRDNFTASGAGTNVTINNGSGLKLNSGKTFVVSSSGTITFGASGTLSGTGGKFTIASGASLSTSNTGGIPASVAVTGVKTFSAGANYIFNAATTTPFPTGTFGNPGDVTIAPGGSSIIALNIDPTISGALTFNSGKLSIGAHTLTLNGTVSGMSASKVLVGNTASALTIGGTGALGTLFFDQTTPGTSNAVSSFTINRASSGAATLGNAIRIGSGSLNLVDGMLSDGGNIITLAGNITGSGEHGGSGKISMVTGGATISSASLGNLELNNAGGFSLSGSPFIGGTLTLASGKLVLGSNNLVLGIAAAISGTPSSTKMIVANGTGTVRKLFSSDGSFLFPIGDATNYTPITLDFTGGSYTVGAYAATNLKAVKHPNNANTTDYLNRYWSIETSGIASPEYTVTSATYVTGDVSGSESNLSAGKYSGSVPWVKFGAATTGTHTLSSSSLNDVSCDFTGLSTAAPSVSSSASTAICAGGSVPLLASGGTGDPALAYTWAPSAGLSATVGSTVTASPVSTTTYTLTITDGNGFTGTATTTVSVNTLPAITGNTTICTGATSILSNAEAGGTWSSSNTAKATVNISSGAVTGVSSGTATITYTASPGCIVTTEATVLPIPAAITGTPGVCVDATTNLGHPVPGGTWSSSATAIATVNSSGVVTGEGPGTANVTYTTPSGCTVQTEVTVYPTPVAITGNASLCLGLTTQLNHVVSGGTWSSSNGVIATVNTAGLVTGEAIGTAIISYTVPSGCTTTLEVTVNELPAPVAGATTVCQNASITLTNADAGGTWSSSNTAVGTIDGAGLLTGLAAGTATITYTLPTTCRSVMDITVNPLPATIGGAYSLCEGNSTTLSNADAFGTWSSSNDAIATVSSSGVVDGVADGAVIISYTIATGCVTTALVTVNPLPEPIVGVDEFCDGTSVVYTTTTGGVNWSSSNVTVAIVNASGVAAGVGSGVVIFTCGDVLTSCSVSKTVTVNPRPAVIAGSPGVCVGESTLLSCATPDGTWSSSNTAIAPVGAGGLVSGVAVGNSFVSYTSSDGCSRSVMVTVNPLPGSITGSPFACPGSTTQLSFASSGGVCELTSDVALVTPLGLVTGVTAGTAIVSYVLPTGCVSTIEVTVNELPPAIGGMTTVCQNETTVLTNAAIGGTWSSSNVGICAIDEPTGMLTGVLAGTSTITYTAPTGCTTTIEVTVNQSPGTMGLETHVCEGQTVTMTNIIPGGVWTGSNPAIGIVTGTSAGAIEGVSEGTVTVTYTLSNGCYTTKEATVHALPAPISGPSEMCDGTVATYTTLSSGVTWTPGGTVSIATINSAGVATGLAAGIAEFYCQFVTTGCYRSVTVTINPIPSAITGMPVVCEGSTTALSSATPAGSWSSSDLGVATVDATGMVTGASAGTLAISYTSVHGCITMSAVTVNPLPDDIAGEAAVCIGETTDLDNISPGGMWTSSDPSIATIDASGTVTALMEGTTTITYQLSTGCYGTRVITVNPLPVAIAGVQEMCLGSQITLSNASAGGTWSSDDIAIANPNMFSGEVTGTGVGSTTIVYTLPTGCTATIDVTTKPLPASISGTAVACVGQTSMLSSADVGGTWSSGSISLADVDGTSGEVTAIAAGEAIITYMLSTGCVNTVTFTVNPLPESISGNLEVCQGLVTELGNALSGGTWESSDASLVAVTPITGLVAGIAAGTVEVTYTLPTGCKRMGIVTVNPVVPPIAGAGAVCEGLTISLANPDGGGTWSTGDASVAVVDLHSGMVTGVADGTVEITYTMPTTCLSKATVTVNPLPGAIGGALQVCSGLTTMLSSASAGGTWSGGASGIAAIDASGVVTGSVPGTASIVYTLPTSCIRSVDVTVNPLPAVHAVAGGGSYCIGGAGVTIGLDNTASGSTYQLYRGSTPLGTLSGTGTADDFGMLTIAGTYTVQATDDVTGCVADMAGSAVVTITSLITPSVTMVSDLGDTVCGGTVTTYTATPVNGGLTPSYEWLVNNVSAGTGSVFSYTPTHGDSVKVILTSSEACPSPAVVSVRKRMIVVDNHMPTINITKTSSDTVCYFAPATFRAATTWGGNAPEYTWLKNGISSGSGITYSVVPDDGDVISCVLTSNYRCRMMDEVTSSGITLHPDSVYIPEVTITAAPGTIVAPGAITTLTANVTGAGSDPVYLWKRNGVQIPGVAGPVLTRNFAHNDVIICQVYGTGVCGLPSFNTVTIKVDEHAGMATIEGVQNNISLNPNPNNGTFVIEGTTVNNEGVLLQVANMLGQVVYAEKVATHNSKLNKRVELGTALSDGMYILTVISGVERSMLRFSIQR